MQATLTDEENLNGWVRP